MSQLVIPECKDCGKCCRVYEIVRVEENSQVPVHFLEASRLAIIEHNAVSRHQMKVQSLPDGTKCCAAFDTVTNRCTIYEQRPRVCRDFPRGGQGCIFSIFFDPKTPASRRVANDRSVNDTAANVRVHYIMEKIQQRRGHQRSQVNGKWSDWRCTSCFKGAKRICHVAHTEECGNTRMASLGDMLKEQKNE